MKIIKVLCFLIFLSNSLLCQNNESMTFIGKERVTVLEERYYVFTIISDSSIVVESYKKSKGQVCYFDIFGDNIDSFTPELLKFRSENVSKENNTYFFAGTNYSIKYNDKGWIFCRDGINLKLASVKRTDDKLTILRNSSLLTFVFYYPSVFLDVGRMLTYEEQLKVKKTLNDSEINEAKGVMDFGKFKNYLAQQLRLAIKN